MQYIKLYKYKRADGGITVSPKQPDVEYTEGLRIVAEKGKILTNGQEQTYCKDVDSAEGWTEIDAPAEEEPEIV